MDKAETESTSSSIKLSYTPPGESDREPKEMVREADHPIRVGRDPGHTGLRLSAKEDRSVSGWAVEITLVGEGVRLNANNISPMNYRTVSGQSGELGGGGPQPLAEFSEDGWIEIPGEEGQVAHRVSWEFRDFSPPPRATTDSYSRLSLGETIFKELSTSKDNNGNLTYLATCAAVVSPWFFTLDQIRGQRVPSNAQIGLMKKANGAHAVERLVGRINLLYANANTESPGFVGNPGRDQLADWILGNHKGNLTAEKIRELLPDMERLNPHPL